MDSITEFIDFLRIEALEILDGILESGYEGNIEDVRLWKIAEAMKKQQQRIEFLEGKLKKLGYEEIT